MNRKLPRLILILLIVALAFALLACSPSGEEPITPPVDDDGGNVVNPIDPGSSQAINKSQIFQEIKEGLVNAGERIQSTTTGTRYVNSSYTLVANSVNVGIEYQANYDLTNEQDSEIMVRVFDYNKEENTAFVYYVDNTLYLQFGEQYVKMDGFGGTSTFKLFYETITTLDMEQTLFSVDFAGNIESMSSFAETQNISKIILSDTEHNVTVKNINLDQLKSTVNDFIQDNIATVGTRLDAITSKVLGFELSDLGRVQVGLFTATEMLTVFEKGATGALSISDFSLTFAGNQSNNIDTYFFDVNYATEYKTGAIRLTQFDDPNTNNYRTMNASAMHFVGDLYIPYFDQSFDAEIMGNFSTDDNLKNEMLFEIINRTDNQEGFDYALNERIFSAIYKNGKMYFDGTGLLENYLGNFLDYEKLGLPRVQVAGLNMSEELQALLEKALGLVTLDINLGGLFGKNEEGYPSLKDNEKALVLLEKVRSEDGIFYLTIDNELVSEVLGESSETIISSIANSLGLEEGLIRDIIELGYFDNLNLVLAWNTVDNSIGITARAGEEEIFILSLTSQKIPESGLIITFPDVEEIGYFDTFEDFNNPETINLHMEGTLRAQGKERSDISSLMGLFVGDISGKNTPFALTVSDSLYIIMDLWQTGDEFYVDASIALNGDSVFDICSDIENPDTLLIRNYTLGVNYKMPREAILELIGELTENKALWQFESIVNAIETIVKDAHVELRDDDILIKLSPYGTGEDKRDPLKEIFGVEGFIAEIALSIGFETPEGLANSGDYVTPVINIVDEVRWTSIYEATWVDVATVSFGDKHIDFKLTFEGESATLVTGIYEYHPEAKLFGQKATYRLFFTDTVNGTSVVEALYSNEMTIDPALENPIPETIEVVYTNGRRGFLAYEIEGFPYTNETIAQLMGGMRAKDFEVVIGKGSIAETRFTLRLNVLGRNIKVPAGDYVSNIPVVAKVVIDPYEYALNKKKAESVGESYYPFKYREEGDGSGLAPETLAIAFYNYPDSQEYRYVYLDEFDWGFDESKITYAGGMFTQYAKYHTLDIALEVFVQAKEVAYVQINDENNGYYTVDSLVKSTYTIPSITTEQNEVRIYFETGKYRIIGMEPKDFVNTDPNCDGYYDVALGWSITEADNVTIDRSIHPLANGKTNKTVCTFGDDLVGKQEVTLTVVCPTRVIGTRADTTLAITSVQYDSEGIIDDQLTTYEAIKVSLATFNKDGNVESDYFEFDPYSTSEENVMLPKVVYVSVVYEGKEQLIGYPVTWIDDGSNVIDADGRILNAFSLETYLRVKGVIGDNVEGGLTQTLEMVIHNKSGSYQNVVMLDENDLRMDVVVRRYNEYNTEIEEGDESQEEAYRRYFIEGLNPYDAVELPKKVTLQFPAISGIEDKTFNASWYLSDKRPASELIASPEGGDIIIYTDIQSDESDGLLNQTIELTLRFDKKEVVQHRIYGVSDSADAGYIIQHENGQGAVVYYVEIDTYEKESQELYDKMYAGLDRIGVGFVDGSRSNDVEVRWLNVEELFAVLQSPLGSSTYYNNGKYEDDIFFLRGVIREGTPLEKEVSMGFKVFARVLGEINFTNFDPILSIKDANGVPQVQLVTETKRASAVTDEEGNTTVTMVGNNVINITFNKYFALRGEYNDVNGILVEGLTTPSQYVNYLFSNASLSFADSVRHNALVYELREDFDDLVYGNVNTTDTDVTITSTHVIIRLTIEKLSEGSCLQPFAVTLTYLKDSSELTEDDAQNEAVEVFDANGNPLYETNEGYVLDDEYTVRYVNSGDVTYNNLTWYADEAVSSLITSESIAQGAIVKNIKYDFFNFTSTRTIKLYTYLPNGQKFNRHLNFYSKNVNLTNYKTEGDSLYRVENGTLEIENVYDYLPLDNFISSISTTIIPNQTAMFISSSELRFTLENGWIPASAFADENDATKFDMAKLSSQITSAGLNSTLLATGSILGYNGERQVINLYVKVRILSNGQISHKDYDIEGNKLVYDQYANDGEGTFTLPKDIKVTFGDVFYEFSETDNVKYEIRTKQEPYEFFEISEITYNNVGHTLGDTCGYDVNDVIYLRVTLPDGNNSLRLTVSFPSRELEDVAYISKTTESSTMQISGVYYIDPYDSTTFNIPSTALFKYVGEEKYLTQNVSWTLASEGAPFEVDENGNYIYVGSDYSGASYLFYSSLQSFDEDDKEQLFIMQVYVLNRSIVNKPAEYKDRYHVENPFATRVEDLPYTIPAEAFFDLSAVTEIDSATSQALATLYGELKKDNNTLTYFKEIIDEGVSIYNSTFVSALSPVIPSVLWKKDATTKLVDDDILVKGGFDFKIYGYVGAGEGVDRKEGQVIEMDLYAEEWEFKAILGLVDYVVEFNDYTMVSLASSFEVAFNVAGAEKVVTFYPEYYADDATKERTVIVWNKNNWADSNELGSVTFRNNYKTSEENTITTYNNYKFDAQMVGIDEISFGFGGGYATSGNVELVIDPLNPVIPTKALARGKLQTDSQLEIDLGEVNIEWTVTDASSTDSIYYVDFAGGTRRIECKVTSSGQNTNEFPFVVNVTYLNRTPDTISTEETGYTNVGKDGAYYPLLRTTQNVEGATIKNYTFVVDPTPTDSRLFNQEGKTNVLYPVTEGYARSNYTLPSVLWLTFANDYEIGSIGAEGLQKLGAEICLRDVEWIISRDISLIGTEVEGGNITAKIRKFRVEYVSNGQTYTSKLYDFVDADEHLGRNLDLVLTTTNRQVEYTYVTAKGENEVLSKVPEGSVINYQKAYDEFYIDPYNIVFPSELYVIFSGTTIPYHATDIEWTYDESYLSNHKVITGKVDPQFMFIMASMQVYGTTLEIQFPIRSRDIPTSIITGSGELTTEPLLGGTLYVLKGKPVEEQLPTKLFYRFDYNDGTSEIAEVPLTFPAVSISTISTVEAGKVYSNIKAQLGRVDDDNIVFTVVVIDPKLFVLKDTVDNSLIGESSSQNATITKGGFIYDFIAIGVNAAGAYVPGPETSILPDKVIISDEGEYMDVMSVEYDVENGLAVVNCRYTFLSFSDSERLSGDKYGSGENSDKMFLSFTVPIKTYSYNWIESSEAQFEKSVFEFDLGTIITASDMPLTVDGIAPLWELNNVNPYRAGQYTATCHYKNAYGKIINGEVTIIINRRSITSGDFTWVKNADDVDFRDRIYTGEKLRVEDFLEFGTFLRDDGTYGMLNGYTIMYSIDGRNNWQYEQPVSVKEEGAPDYFVRIIINESDDYNYSGYVDYRMIINKCQILKEDVYFHQGDHERIEESDYNFVSKDGANSSVSVRQIKFEYDGTEKLPNVGGIPRDTKYQTSFAIYDPESTNQAYNANIRPVNAGTYIMRLYFDLDQRNYSISADTELTIVIIISKKEVNYSVLPTMAYTGDYFDAVVVGLPAVLGDIRVEYSYFNKTTNTLLPAGSKLRDAGTYLVTVKIFGGINYPSANTGEEGSLNVAGLMNAEVKVEKRRVILNVGTVSSEYLDPLKPLNSALTIVSADNPEEQGIVGKDSLAIFGALQVAWTEGTLTDKHMVGSYPLALVGNVEHKNYEFVAINNGTYNIIAEYANTLVINNKAELDDAIARLTDGATARWYLMAGEYGTITINKNASVSIIGSYDISTDTQVIAVSFTQIKVEKGAVLLDIISFGDIADASAVSVGKDASSLTVRRCEFARKGQTMLTNSSAIRTAYGYSDTVYVEESYFSGYATAIYLEGGNLELATSTLYKNANGIYSQSGNLVLNNNEFKANRGVAVNVAYSKATLSIFDNLFDSNDTAIKTVVALRNDIRVQNTFSQNTVTFDGWSE